MHLLTSASILLTLSTSVIAAPPVAPKIVTPVSGAIATPVNFASPVVESSIKVASPIAQSTIKAALFPPSIPVPSKVGVVAGVNAAVSAQAQAAALILSAQLSASAQLSTAPINSRQSPLPSLPWFTTVRPVVPLPSSSPAAGAVCPCFTATVVSSNIACPVHTLTGGSHCIHPLCLELTTTTVPASNSYCPITPTYTSYLPCETSCERGCGKGTTTITAKETCLANTLPFPSGHTPQPFEDAWTRSFSLSLEKFPTPTPASLSPPRLPTPSPLEFSSPPARSTPTPPRSSSPAAVPATTPRPRPCYTPFVLSPSRCPAEVTCPAPDCISISTISVPAGPLRGCPVTPTQTLTRSCEGGCGACSTSYRTVTVSEWVEVRESASVGIRESASVGIRESASVGIRESASLGIRESASVGIRKQGLQAQESGGIKGGEKAGGSGEGLGWW